MTHSNTRNVSADEWRPAATWIMGILLIWALSPEVRRLVDWRAGFAVVSLVSILPLIALLVPLGALIHGGGLARIDKRLLALAWVWFGGFTSALVIGILSGNEIAAAIYSYATFCLPAVFGLWVASIGADRTLLFDKVARFLLLVATPLSLYAMIQLAHPLPWEVAWMKQAHYNSMGVPLPFQFRPFSTLNGPAVFADFLVAAILLNLPRIRKASALLSVQLALCGGALALTEVRSAWLGLAVGVACFLAFGSNRLANFSALTVAVLLFFGVTFTLPRTIGSTNFDGGLGARLSTLTNLESDVSFTDRERYFGEPLTQALQTPQGTGLGVIGTAAKLGSAGVTNFFDNGYIARLSEMGWFGAACYLFVSLGAFAFVLSRRAGLDAAVIGAAAALQLDLIALDVSGDAHTSLGGVMFWLSLALVSHPSKAT